MAQPMWINLPTQNISKAKTFFTQIGFKLNEMYASADMLSLVVGDNKVIVNLFLDTTFKMFTSHEITDTKKSTEVLFSIGAETRQQVDDFAKKAKAAGGQIYAEPGEKDGWMYGCGIVDLDGHRWNALYMDMSKMPKGPK